MIRCKRMLESRRNRRMFENVEDPCELLASLVDLGSVDVEDAFLACLSEMSAAECKRVLAKCGMGFAPAEGEFPADAEDGLEDADDFEEPEVEDDGLDEDADDEVEEVEDDVEDDEAELESRLRRLERKLCRR